MNRLLLVTILGLVGLAAGRESARAFQQTSAPEPAARPAIAQDTGVAHSTRLLSGVPLGGVGTGGFQLMTDGAIARAIFNNNPDQPTGDLKGCFAAVRARIGDSAIARVLALHNAYGLPAITSLDYDGLYPQATLTYADKELPLALTLRAFSPLVPFDIRSSSFPAAAFIFEIRNTANVPVEVSLAFSWENILGVGGTASRGPFQNRDGDQISRLPDAEGFFGLKFTGPFPAALPEAETLLRDNATGDYTLLTAPERPDAVVTMGGWNALDARPGWWDAFVRDGQVSGEAPPGKEGSRHPAGVICVHVTLTPNSYTAIPFAFAWNTPHQWAQSGVDYGHYYQKLFPDSTRAAHDLLADWRTLLALTEEWQQRLLDSNLPHWLTRRLINAVSPLTTHTLHTRDDAFAVRETSGQDSTTDALHASRTGQLAALPTRLTASRLLLDFFPQLASRELVAFAQAQALNGSLPRSLGDTNALTAVPHKLTGEPADENPTPAPPAASALPLDTEAICAFVLQIAQYAFTTGDRAFRDLYYYNVRLAMRAVLARGLSAEGAPLPEGFAASLPGIVPPAFAHPLKPGQMTLWLAALRTAQEMARQAQDGDFAQECQKAITRAQAALHHSFWNGQFFAEKTPASDLASQPQNAPVYCAANQLWGQWATDALGLEPVLPVDEITSTLQSLQTRNTQAAGATFGPLLRASARAPQPNDPKTVDCAPAVSILGQAALMIRHGMPTDGVALLQKLDTTRNTILRSPWQTPAIFRADTGQSETPGLASLSHAADWNILATLEGFDWNPEAGLLTLTPNLPGTWRSLSAPLFAPTFWGHLDYRPTARGGTIAFSLDRLFALSAPAPARLASGSSARLVIKSLRVPGPPPGADARDVAVRASLGRVPVGVRAAPDASGAFTLYFSTPLQMAVGDRLEVDLH